MQRKLYTRGEQKNYWMSLLATIISGGVFSGLVFFSSPGNMLREALANVFLAIFLVLTISWITGKSKLGIIFAFGAVSLLILNRTQMLGWPTFGLWLIVFGLISLTI